MHDLRRQALESGKTVSRKAQSRQRSRATSRNSSAPASRATSRNNSSSNSRANSRNPSPEGSDDEGDINGASFNVDSIDEILLTQETEKTWELWSAELSDCIEDILEAKRSSVEGREATLAAYVRILTNHYAEEEIRGIEEQLLTKFLRSIKLETSEKETILAMNAISMTLITSPSDKIYDIASTPLRRAASDSISIPTKAAAIHALGTCTFFGGAADQEILETMSYLLEIASTDGNSIDAPDDSDTVTAAIEEWGLLATLIDDLSEETEEAMEVFDDQLDSFSLSVQIAAGENVALLYEKPWTPLENKEMLSDHIVDNISLPQAELPDGPTLIKRYNVYRQTNDLVHKISSLATIHSRSLSTKDKRKLHTSFADILNSVENPTRGPKYQNAISNKTGREYGSRAVVKIYTEGVLKIDKWWKMHRLQGLRRILHGGFVSHYMKNPVVFESLPITMTTENS